MGQKKEHPPHPLSASLNTTPPPPMPSNFQLTLVPRVLDCLLDTFSWRSNREPFIVSKTGFSFSLSTPTQTCSFAGIPRLSGQQGRPAAALGRHRSAPDFSPSCPLQPGQLPDPMHSISSLALKYISLTLFFKLQVFILYHLGYYCGNILTDVLAASLICLNLLSIPHAAARERSAAQISSHHSLTPSPLMT